MGSIIAGCNPLTVNRCSFIAAIMLSIKSYLVDASLAGGLMNGGITPGTNTVDIGACPTCPGKGIADIELSVAPVQHSGTFNTMQSIIAIPVGSGALNKPMSCV